MGERSISMEYERRDCMGIRRSLLVRSEEALPGDLHSLFAPILRRLDGLGLGNSRTNMREHAFFFMLFTALREALAA